MKSENKILMNLLIFLYLVFGTVSCAFSRSLEKAPYTLTAEMVMDRDKYGQDASLSFDLCNNSDKDICSFYICFYLWKGDEPAIRNKPSLIMKVKREVKAGERIQDAISLDSLLDEIPEEPFEVEFPYLREIDYSDGTKWKDLFGDAVL